MVTADDDAAVPAFGAHRVLRRHPVRAARAAADELGEVDIWPRSTYSHSRPSSSGLALNGGQCSGWLPERASTRQLRAARLPRPPVEHRHQRRCLPVADPAEQGAVARYRHPLGDHLVGGDGHRQPRPDRLALYGWLVRLTG